MRRKLRKTGSGVGAGDVEIVRVEAAEAAAAVGEARSGRAATGSARRRAVATGISRGEGPATSARWSVRGWMRARPPGTWADRVKIIDRMVVGNSLGGLLTKIAEIQTEKALVIILAADDEMVESLRAKNFKVYYGITRLVFTEDVRTAGQENVDGPDRGSSVRQLSTDADKSKVD